MLTKNHVYIMSSKIIELIDDFAINDVKYIINHLEQPLLKDIQKHYNLDELNSLLSQYPQEVALNKKRSKELKKIMTSIAESSAEYAVKIEQLYEQKENEPPDNIVADIASGVILIELSKLLCTVLASYCVVKFKVLKEADKKHSEVLNEFQKVKEQLQKMGISPKEDKVEE